MADPLVAITLGSALGVALVVLSRFAARLVTPEDPARGLAVVAMLTLLRMILVVAALAAFFFLVRTGFLPFAISLVGVFVIALGIEAVRMSRSARPTGTAG